MKKIILIACAMYLALSGAKAQLIVEGNIAENSANVTSSVQTTSEKTEFEGNDIGVTFNTDADIYGLSYGTDVSKNGYFIMGMNMGFGDLSMYNVIAGLGLKKRYVMNDSFLIQGKIYPYLGYGSTSVKTVDSYDKYGNPKYKTKDESEITYGAAANLSIGIKLWNTEKGNSTFVTFGYYISAPEFETKNMIDNGNWGVGITTILN